MINIEQLEQLPIHFIIGAGRSGTTLLNAILNAHPSVSCTPEAKKPLMTFYTYAHKQPLPTRIIKDFKSFVKKRYNKKQEQNGQSFSFDEAWFGDLAVNLPKLSYANFAKQVLLTLNAQQKPADKVQILIDKNPTYTFTIKQLIDLYPDAKFLVALRDYRAYYLSQKQNKAPTLFSKYIANSCGAVSYFWKMNYDEISHLQRQYPNKILLVPYERIVTDKENMLREICSFIGINFDEAMLQHNKNEQLTKQLADTNDDDTLSEYHKRKRGNIAKTTFTDRLEAWKAELTPAEIRTLEVIAGNIGKQFGYQPTQTANTTQKISTYFSNCIPIAITYLSTQLLMKHYYSLPLGVRNFLIKYFKLRH